MSTPSNATHATEIKSKANLAGSSRAAASTGTPLTDHLHRFKKGCTTHTLSLGGQRGERGTLQGSGGGENSERSSEKKHSTILTSPPCPLFTASPLPLLLSSSDLTSCLTGEDSRAERGSAAGRKKRQGRKAKGWGEGLGGRERDKKGTETAERRGEGTRWPSGSLAGRLGGQTRRKLREREEEEEGREG